MKDKPIKFFCYGTLMNDHTVRSVLGKSKQYKEATLKSFIKTGLNIREEEGGEVHGHVWEIDKEELEILDYYEGYPNLYIRINVEVDGEEVLAYQIAGT